MWVRCVVLVAVLASGCRYIAPDGALRDFIARQSVVNDYHLALEFDTSDAQVLHAAADGILRQDPRAGIIILPQRDVARIWSAVLKTGHEDESEPDLLSSRHSIILVRSERPRSTWDAICGGAAMPHWSGCSNGAMAFPYGPEAWRNLKEAGIDFLAHAYPGGPSR